MTVKSKPTKLELPKNPELLEKWCLTILESLERFWGEDLPMWREIVLKTCDVNWKHKYRLQARKGLLHDINEYAMESMNQQT